MRKFLTGAVIVFLGLSVSAADKMNPAFFGTWKMNIAKSHADPGPLPRSQTVTIEPRGDMFVITIDIARSDGTKDHSVRVAALDGKDVIVEGATNPNGSEAYVRVSDRAFLRMARLNGQTRGTLTATLSPDGHTYTAITTGINIEGQPVHNSAIMEKQ